MQIDWVGAGSSRSAAAFGPPGGPRDAGGRAAAAKFTVWVIQASLQLDGPWRTRCGFRAATQRPAVTVRPVGGWRCGCAHAVSLAWAGRAGSRHAT
eukprot:2269826-Prymnesium_polylepis.1